jgi:hypothetical protein
MAGVFVADMHKTGAYRVAVTGAASGGPSGAETEAESGI